ncbi:hypothetical protein DOY81_002861 [Sarcophaga bullata]|nr:hypothetical protein DOY81_002861 [Sarcophaga bullata]
MAILPLLGGILHAFFPESPKFLMFNGRNSEALECLKTIYAINKRKPKSSYPITKLRDEDPKKTERHSLHASVEFRASHNRISDKRRLAKEEFLLGLAQLRPMFRNPYFKYSLQVYSMFFFLLLGFNSIRLWLPQIFATMVEFEHKNMKDISMCRVLEYNYNKTKLLTEDTNGPTCDVVHISSDSYTDNIIVAVVSFSSFILVTLVVNKVGNHLVLKVCLLLTLLSSTAMYFSKTQMQTLILASTLTSTTSIGATAIIGISVNYFPTYMRTMVVIMIMTFGRFGSVLGNVLFPYFISLGCLPPFLLIGGVILISFILSLCLPNSSNPS